MIPLFLCLIPYFVVCYSTFCGIADAAQKNQSYEPGELYELLLAQHRDGQQLSVHSQGDCASVEAVKDIRRVLADAPSEDPRPRLEHLHTDSPMYPPNPLLIARTAVTRLTRGGEVIGKDQAISVDEAIKAITIGAAYQLFMEDKVGSIEVGKLADFVILKEDPYTVRPKRIHEIEILGTYRGGVSTK